MPYTIKKVKGGYSVKNKSTGRTMSKKTTKTKASSQVRLLNRIDKKKVDNKKKVKRTRKKYSY